MSGEPKTEDGTLLRRVPVIVRSWDGPNSRIGLEMDLGEMPWGPFDALGKRLSLLLPVSDPSERERPASESQVERALRHVEHAADRCAEFAQLANGDQALWLRSQETWEWVRKYLTSLWVQTEVDGTASRASLVGSFQEPEVDPAPAGNPGPQSTPKLPGAASTLNVAARALRSTPLAVWREAIGSTDPEAPTREEAIQTLLGVAKILGGQTPEGTSPSTEEDVSIPSPTPRAPESTPEDQAAPADGGDPDQVSFDFAQGYDEGYRMGRKVGLALGSRKARGSGEGKP